MEEDLSQWNRLYYVGADAKQSGVLQGELIAKDVLEDGEGENGAVTLSPEVDKNQDGKIQYIIFVGRTRTSGCYYAYRVCYRNSNEGIDSS